MFETGIYKGKFKSKFHPTIGHEDAQGGQRYISTLSLISALDGGGWSTPRLGHFASWKDPVPIV
jgi:hypothetical protein